jgi:hypothetical protein
MQDLLAMHCTCDVQVSIYGVETAALPDTASAAGGDFAALLSTQSTEGAANQILHSLVP